MIDDTDKPAEKASGKPQAVTSATAPAARPVAKPRTPRAAPASSSTASRKRPASATKAKPTTASKSVKRAAVAKKSITGEKAAVKALPVADKKTGASKPGKVKKPKLVRDSFAMPKGEYTVIATLKERCQKSGVPAKKSEILRAAIANLAKLSDASLAGAIRHLEVIKTGRPAKGSK